MNSYAAAYCFGTLSPLPSNSFVFGRSFSFRGYQRFSRLRGVAAPPFEGPLHYLQLTTVPLVLRCNTLTKPYPKKGKTNLSHDGLNPAHVPFLRVNNPTFTAFCNCVIGRADIEGSKSNVAPNAWLPQASYPCGNFSDTSCVNCQLSKGSLGQHFCLKTVTEGFHQTSI